ncbi:MAG: alkaline phosphatase family protein [Thermoanaerobaculaceae bacterium]
MQKKLFLVTLAILAALVLASSLVLPKGSAAYVTLSRWGGTATLLPPTLRFSPWPLASRLRVEKSEGVAVLPAEWAVSSTFGTAHRLQARLFISGSGRLPVSASEIRRKGLGQALGGQLLASLPSDLAKSLWQVTDFWEEVFPQEANRRRQFEEAVASFLLPLKVEKTQVQAFDSNLLKAEANRHLAELTRPRGRLVVLGLDALDWQLVDELTAKGALPNFHKLLQGALQAELHVPAPLISPVVWTTIATGQPPQVHGVLDFLEPDPAGGPPHPVSAHSRKVPAIWEMLAASGKSVAVIGWWATFPAQAPLGGVLYSDRLTEQLLGLQSLIPGLADPPRAQEEALQLAVKPQDLTLEQLKAFAPIQPEELSALDQRGWEDPVAGLARLLAATSTVERLTAKELRASRDALFVYLEGTDTVGHLFAPYRPPALPTVDPASARRFGQVVDRYMAQVDAWLGSILKELRPEDSLVIVSDHGFTWGNDRPQVASGTHTATAVWWHRPVGVLLVSSPAIKPSAKRLRLDVLQVAPLLLALAGLPQAAELPGTVPSWVEEPPPARVHYTALLGPPKVQRLELPPEARAEELAKLRALGYLGGGDSGLQSLPVATSPSPGFNRVEARRLNNQASSLAAAGQKEEAERVFRQAIAADPTYAAPHYNLSLLLRGLRRYQEADAELWQAVDAGLADPELTLVRGALDYRERGELARAEALLQGGLARFPQSVPLLLNAGVFYGELGRLEDARKLLEKAVNLAPTNARAHRNLAVALAGLGDKEAAVAHLKESLRLDPSDTAAKNELARLLGQSVQ